MTDPSKSATGPVSPGPEANSLKVAPHDTRAEIAQFLRALFRPGDVFEVRAPKCQERPGSDYRATTSGYYPYALIDTAAADITKLDVRGVAPAIYVTLNPVVPGLLARANGHLKTKAATTTGDADIVCRRWFLVDCDPVRPADISSTDGELAMADRKATVVADHLRDLGWPAPVRVMSGNGHHLLFRIELPADDGGLVDRVLKGIAAKFNDAEVKIDAAVGNAARVTKIPGTVARKGEDLRGMEGVEDRPHRRAKLLSVPGLLTPVSQALLETVALPALAPVPVPKRTATVSNAPVSALKFAQFEHTPSGVRAYLEQHGAMVVAERPKGESTILDLERCPVTGVEAAGTEISVIVGSDGTIGYKNMHDRGQGIGWVDVREFFEPGYLAHRDLAAAGRGEREEQGPEHECPAPPWTNPRPVSGGKIPPPFPIAQAFPPALVDIRDYIEALAESLQVPVDVPAMLLLPTLAVAIAQNYEIERRPGWREVGALWVLPLLESGERKSALFKRLMEPLNDWEKDQAERMAPDIAASAERREILEQERRACRHKASSGDEEASKRAINIAQQLATEDELQAPALSLTEATSEGLISMMIANGERALVASPEGDALDVMMGRYDDKGRPNLGIWLKGYSGDQVRAYRRGRPPDFLKRPVLNVGIVVQPEAVRGMFASRVAVGRGLMARFFSCVPASRIGFRKIAPPPVPEPLEIAYVTALRRLLELPLNAGMGPHVIRLDEDASAMFLEFETRIESELGRGGFLGDRRAWGAKLCGGILRIALVLHCVEVYGRPTERGASSKLAVNSATMQAALAWAPYLIEQERLAYSVVGCDRDSVVAERILQWLERTRHEEFSRRDCFTDCRGVFVDAVEDVDGALKLLEELGYLRGALPPASGPKRGRPASPQFVVNPLWQRGGAR